MVTHNLPLIEDFLRALTKGLTPPREKPTLRFYSLTESILIY
ncbi:hypothetical protein POREN0001_0160 [Porphyromonas endodontalis ATCC 35406]|uniref:Uncharacterized protein n=1 Tax=Porphyromonas endodontalis (strain ATCC 35406 / DSM 24491 / JCM 8526 / CCUG 16442 / BCRC 14492 / NCTC 13058 / HG 370) TaxID=553175 RepID=C3JA61_POREA|nr:hypothetical protein POREN0001_0160 [Porphyromonas endodontalis ATCC 35406]